MQLDRKLLFFRRCVKRHVELILKQRLRLVLFLDIRRTRLNT